MKLRKKKVITAVITALLLTGVAGSVVLADNNDTPGTQNTYQSIRQNGMYQQRKYCPAAENCPQPENCPQSENCPQPEKRGQQRRAQGKCRQRQCIN